MNQVAINDIGTAEDFLKAIDESIKYIQVNDMVKGIVVGIDREGVLVDIGYKTEAFVPRREVTARRISDINEVLSIGQAVEGTVLSIDEEGQYTLSMKQAEVEMLWNSIEAIFHSDNNVVSGEITKIVKGGMIVDIGVRAFLPASQFHVERTEDFSSWIGKTVEAKVIQFEKEKGNIVISRKALLQNEFKQDKIAEFGKLRQGEVYIGKVSGITNFGVFVSLGMVSGLLHKTKMGKYTPEQFTIGHDVEVEVLEIDIDNDRLSFALKV
jgi:small subunit ribosomal protein S1